MQSYTFHVSLPGHGRVWRKVELPEEATLADLHNIIQVAFDFDNDHLYSFFMSGKAWDSTTEYTLPEGATPFSITGVVDEEGKTIEDFGEEEEDEALAERNRAIEQTLAALPEPPVPPADETIEMPTTEQARMMFSELQNNQQLREQFMQGMAAQLGVPPAMANMIVGNLENIFNNISDEELESIMKVNERMAGADALGTFMGSVAGDTAGDVRTTTLASLKLKKGKKFLYLFDYGDEWHFNVKVDAINQATNRNLTYPRIVERVGDAPPQYPDWDDDDWEDEE